MKTTRRRIGALALAASLTSAVVLGDAASVDAGYWRKTWYGPIYVLSSSETNSMADSAYNVPVGLGAATNPLAAVVPAYRFWWSQTAKTARMLRKCLGIHFTASPQIVSC